MDAMNFMGRLNLIIDLIFRPKNANALFSKLVSVHLSKQRDELESRFDEKVQMLCMESEMSNGIAKNHNRQPILRIPIRGIEKECSEPWMRETVSEKSLNLDRIHVSFTNHQLPPDQIKQEASINLAKHLLDNGFIHSCLRGNTIELYIHAFNV